ncbi:rhombosortase [Glaciecola sp. 1036]|uniref:rhombosortase n=1 Tax=Alteromonadaceae TaxID=72275 RepID=UPI003CFF61EB
MNTLLVIASICIITQLFDLKSLLEFNRTAIENGQIYRLITAHLVHQNTNHLLLNLAGLTVLILLFSDYCTNSQQLILFLVCGFVISLSILIFSDLEVYLGLSGCLHGIFAWGVCQDVKKKRKSGWVLAIGLIIKIIYEQFFYQPGTTEKLIEISVAVDAHLWGAIAGVIFVYISLLLKRDIFSRN